jgi:hypothetical protein
MPKCKLQKVEELRRKREELHNREKKLLQAHKAEERKARTKRLCLRHGMLEKYMPDLMSITDQQFEEFIKRGINTTYGNKILGEIVAKGERATSEPLAKPSGDGDMPVGT